jgi:flagellum-specific peptidoglycan hydrolase FlgJ
MAKPVPYAHNPIQELFERMKGSIKLKSRSFWGRVGVVALLVYVMLHKDISIDLEFQSLPDAPRESLAAAADQLPSGKKAKPVSLKENVPAGKKTKATGAWDDNLANTFSNLGFEEDAGSKAEREARRRKKLAYVKKYAAYAKDEMKRAGIPASITLAQGLLESNAGESRLAVDNNNHFGIKCFSRTCKKGHCSNYTDDTHKDFFRKYKSPAESYKAHSALLKGDRYKFLFKYKTTDYISWATGLKKAGYATDPNYDQKLIELIQDLGLDEYDD